MPADIPQALREHRRKVHVRLHGGEDYELLFTINQTMWSHLENNPHIHPIGYVIEASHGVKLATANNIWVDITAQDWEGVGEQA